MSSTRSQRSNGRTVRLTRALELVPSNPVASFYYRGNHSHPVRRTVLLTERTSTCFTGYEVREGNMTRMLENAPLKSYRISNIARRRNCRLDSAARKVGKNRLNETTLLRTTLRSLAKVA